MTQTRKPRRKATTDLGKSILQRERQKLVREQAVLAEKLAEDAKMSRRLAVVQATPDPIKEADKAIQRSIVRRVAGVLASEGVTPHIDVVAIPAGNSVDAWTNFERIHIGYHVHKDVRLTAAVLRGLFYHEGGHIRWTVPFLTLQEMANEAGCDTTLPEGLLIANLHHAWNALEDQRMETAVVSDSPRKAGYFVPMVLSELALDVNSAASNWPLMVWRRYLPSKVVDGARKLFVAKNGANGENYARAIEEIVNDYVQSTDPVQMYEAVQDMAQMFKRITPLAIDLGDVGHQQINRVRRQPDPDALQIPIDPSMIPDSFDTDGGEEPDPDDFDPEHLLGIIIAAWNAPETLIKVEYVLNATTPGKPESSGKASSGTAQSEPEPEEEEEEEEEDDPNDFGPEDEDEPEAKPEPPKPSKTPKASKPEPAEVADDEADEDDESDEGGDEGGNSGTHTDEGEDAPEPPTAAADDDDDLDDDDLEEALADAEAQRNSDTTLDQDVRSFAEARDDASSKLDLYCGGRSTDVLAIAEATNLAADMQRAFETATVDMAPSWHEQQRRGILNVVRYNTRQPGDVEFFKGFVDNGNPGCDIAVSLLLDYSGSMGGSVEALAKVAYGCKVACDNLAVPCTVVLWDTDARVLWDAGEKAEYLPTIASRGGTDPAIALADLENQMYSKAKHIVLIMTDDAWSDSAPSLAAFRQEGRTIIGLAYDDCGASDRMAESMRRRGADAAHAITNLDEIPKFLEQTLVGMA